MNKVDIPEPPITPKRPVCDNVHGVAIVDPYRWLEDPRSEETMDWIASQNQRTEDTLSQLQERKAYAESLKPLLSQKAVGMPLVCGNRLFYTERDEGAEQFALWVMELADTDSKKVLVDPNVLGRKGLVSLDWWQPSRDGSMLAYGLSEKGDEWSVLHVLRVDDGQIQADRIERTRMPRITWHGDNLGFYYCRYPRPGDVPAGEENYNNHLFSHRIGDDPSEDTKIFGEGRPKADFYDTYLSQDGEYLILSAGDGWNATDLFWRHEAQAGAGFTPIVVGEKATFRPFGVVGSSLYVLTNYLAPRYRVCAIDLQDPEFRNWRDIILEDPSSTIDAVRIVGDRLVASVLKDAAFKLYVFDIDGTSRTEVPLPAQGTVSAFTGRYDDDAVFFTFESFAIPPAVYTFQATDPGPPEVFVGDPDLAALAQLKTRQVFYQSKDGTTVPMFIVERQDGKTGSRTQPSPRPTVLTGYGGFNLGRTPTYFEGVIPWLMNGGVYALANLRGGNEYGEEWHKAGMRENKQNVFDDFLSAAQYLIDKGVTDRNRLAIWGRSNGGLLVGAALTQKPDLFAAVACGVPLLDMVRYHKFLIARLWCSEYGDPDIASEFAWLHKYSPYHNVRQGVRYPAVYFYTASSDSRVDPMHARKTAALLQEIQAASGSRNPILLREESDAGHGVGKPVRKVVAEQSEMWAFLAWRVGLTIQPSGALPGAPLVVG